VEICPKFDAENLSKKLLAEMEFCKIDPWCPRKRKEKAMASRYSSVHTRFQ
jgi:hypothetical protein